MLVDIWEVWKRVKDSNYIVKDCTTRETISFNIHVFWQYNFVKILINFGLWIADQIAIE